MKAPKKGKHKAKPTSTAGKIWYFIWHDNSLLSWLVNIVLAYVLIKYLLYPGIGLLLGTTLPVVAVVSESMDHDFVNIPVIDQHGQCTMQYRLCSEILEQKPQKSQENMFWQYCGQWYEDKGITQEQFNTFPFKKGFSKGDIIILVGKKPQNIELGDVIVFNANAKAYPIIHRVIDHNEGVFQTKGDHNPDQISDLSLDETRVTSQSIEGVAVAKIPYLGWVKIGLVDLFNPPRRC